MKGKHKEKAGTDMETGDSFEYEGWIFTVKKIQSHRIERMRIEKVVEK